MRTCDLKTEGVEINQNFHFQELEKKFNTEIQIFSILYIIIYLIQCSQHVNLTVC